MAWTKAKIVIATGILVIFATGATVVLTHNKPDAAIPAGAVELNFINVNANQVLEIYKYYSGLNLTISPEVNRLNAGITLKAYHIDEIEAAGLIQKALLAQAGIVITKSGSKATVTYNGSPIASHAPPPPTVAIPPK